jgi:O-6-methylguanine DNA methyltransferase
MNPPVFYFATFATPVGRFALAVDPAGALAATAFGGLEELRARLPAGRLRVGLTRTGAARRAVEKYFRAPRRLLPGKVAPTGTPFQQRVWRALRRIPPGQTRTYGALAADLHSSPRAVGRASAANPVCLFIPCHRLVGAGGALTGYAFGVGLKRRLLAAERAPGFAPPAGARQRRRALRRL